MKRLFDLKFTALFIFLTLHVFSVAAQSVGKIAGKVTDKKTGEALIGLTVKVQGSTKGTSTDVEGRYSIPGLTAGKHTLVFSYIGYSSKSVSDIIVKASQVTNTDIVMEESEGNSLNEVVINVSARRENIGALYAQQKNSISISSGISADVIKRSPDRNTSEVLKRVSGASIQDGKFVVVRGLSDRYNSAQINGASLPSSEPDRKAFAFDLFPSNLVDRIVINKTASPDLPGDFAGGVVQIFTKDVPDQNFLELSLGYGYNTESTGKDFVANERGSAEWLGFYSKDRKLPSDFPKSLSDLNSNTNELINASKKLPNAFAEKVTTALPTQNYQLSWGVRKDLKNEAVFGSIISLTYRNAQNLLEYQRNDWDNETRTSPLRENIDSQNRYNVTWGGLANFSYKKGTSKYSWKNSYNRVLDELYYNRQGQHFVNLVNTQSRNSDPVERSLYNTQVEGEHQLNSDNLKLNWNLNFADISRNQSDLRSIAYQKNFTQSDSEYSLDPRSTRRFFSSLSEQNYGANVNLSLPFEFKESKSTFKTGLSALYKDRDFQARSFQYEELGNANATLPYDQIFDSSNIGMNGYILDETTNPQDVYAAQSILGAGYLMVDSKWEKIRAVFGSRFEYYGQRLDAVGPNLRPADGDQDYFDILPSANLSYSITDKSNFRISGSRTVSRPEFREIAPFQFYDYQLSAFTQGTSSLKRSSNWNADVRYEFYPSNGEAFTVSGFYKFFENPIELFANSQSNADSRLFEFINSTNAKTFGIELDFRKKLNFLADANILEDLTLFANATLIKSEVKDQYSSWREKRRPLQGQSPYLINGGLQYSSSTAGLSITALYNRIGERLSVVGYQGYPDWFENARDLVDFQVSQKLWGEKAELKLNISDVFNQKVRVYQNLDSKNSYDDSLDRNIYNYRPGSNYSLSFNYRF